MASPMTMVISRKTVQPPSTTASVIRRREQVRATYDPPFLRGPFRGHRARRPGSSPKGTTVAGQRRDLTGLRWDCITAVLDRGNVTVWAPGARRQARPAGKAAVHPLESARASEEAGMRLELHWRSEDGVRLPMALWRPGPGHQMISSGIVGGGLGPREWVLNAQVAGGYDRIDPVVHLAELAAGLRPTRPRAR